MIKKILWKIKIFIKQLRCKHIRFHDATDWGVVYCPYCEKEWIDKEYAAELCKEFDKLWESGYYDKKEK